MRQPKNIVHIFLFVFFTVCCANAQVGNQREGGQIVFFVSTEGEDADPGTEEKPLATLTGARNAIRRYKKENKVTAPIVVSIKGGRYEMTEPLVLLPEDGGTSQYPVIYKAEEGSVPVFSGGKRITGFTVGNNGIWEAKVPESKYYNWRFDQLYVNENRAVLARTPNKGFLQIDTVAQNIWEKGTGRIAERAQQIITFDENDFKTLKGISEEELKLVRFRAFHKWDFTVRHLDKIDVEKRQIFTSGKGMKPWNPLKKGGRIILENYKAALDTPGEWFLDTTGTLFYVPLPGEEPENSTVVAPVLENLITVLGNATNDKFVAHIRFEGLAFSHCHYRMPRTGSEPNQAAALINAAVMLEGAKDVTFKNCKISKTGQHGLWFGKGCSNSLVEHCYLNDLGGGGIYLGDFDALEGKEHTKSIRITNNIIQTGGQEFPSAVGVWVGHSSDNEVSHNDIGNFYYSGISVGWVWGYADSQAKRNKIIYNRIHHIGWGLLSDMAAVYTLGKSEGTVISNNVIHHVHAFSYGGWGLYTDEGSSDILMENNLVYSTKTGGFHQHYGKNNIIRNNIFAFAKKYQIQSTREEGHRSFDFTNNIVVFNEGVVLQGPWTKINVKMDNNLYWNTDGDTYDFAGKSFKEWQRTAHDANSLIGNPDFKDVDRYNFSIDKKSKVRAIGFKPFDYKKAGVFGDMDWKENAKLPKYIIQQFDEVIETNMKVEE